ncbi:hypothetical protein [Streptomyces sp. URMC 123]|uniref:hypothetical protein n=1 Tax=Streptomyces sp. URMC 123 TaxID=3423403 RepID=UPI003F1D106C
MDSAEGATPAEGATVLSKGVPSKGAPCEGSSSTDATCQDADGGRDAEAAPGEPGPPRGDSGQETGAGDPSGPAESAAPVACVASSGPSSKDPTPGVPATESPASEAPASEAPATEGPSPEAAATADPVRALMRRHRRLCARAVDPLEIAAGLEAHGLTDRTAARFRHRDVFSLAEELYARSPREEEPPGTVLAASDRTVPADGQGPVAAARPPAPDGGPPPPDDSPASADDRPPQAAEGASAGGGPPAGRASCVRPGPGRVARAGYDVLHLAPGAVCLAAVAVGGRLATADPTVRLAAGMAGVLAVGAAGRLCLRRSPLSTRGHPRAGADLVWTCWLLGFLLSGDALLAEVLFPAADPEGAPGAAREPVPGPPAAVAVGLAFAVAPAAWCARWFSVRAWRRLVASRGPDEFAAAVRPLLNSALGLFLCALLVLLIGARLALGAGPYDAAPLVSAVTLGALLFLARLLAVHGRADAAAIGTAAACAVEAAALGSALAARLPGFEPLARPVETAVSAYGPSVVSLVACGTAALVLLAYATIALSRASAHCAGAVRAAAAGPSGPGPAGWGFQGSGASGSGPSDSGLPGSGLSGPCPSASGPSASGPSASGPSGFALAPGAGAS